MSTEIIHTELPPILPQGWKKTVSERLGIHRNTLQQALKRGESDETYRKIIHTAAIIYGKPKQDNLTNTKQL